MQEAAAVERMLPPFTLHRSDLLTGVYALKVISVREKESSDSDGIDGNDANDAFPLVLDLSERMRGKDGLEVGTWVL